MRDSYNVNGLGQIAAVATLKDLPYYRRIFAKIIATRDRVAGSLALLGFSVRPSQTNFILAKPPGPPAKEWLELLRAKKILVRWFSSPVISDYLRITIGTDEEMNQMLAAVRAILRQK